MNQRSRITGHTAPAPLATDPDMSEALRQVIAQQIGPRRPGLIYGNVDGEFRVDAVITDRSEARRILKRRGAQFAVIVTDHTGTQQALGSVWTGSDRVLKAVS
ncbi:MULTISPECIES: hypothetical protein [unclassified Streptomyces]|uniref:hypothetical protein n=1 Tax=unclassified Streptomyces TaxID=2593676 RepID=UPI0033F46328